MSKSLQNGEPPQGPTWTFRENEFFRQAHFWDPALLSRIEGSLLFSKFSNARSRAPFEDELAKLLNSKKQKAARHT